VSNVVQFPLSSAAAASRVSFPVGPALLDEPPPDTHVVQFYHDDAFLFDTVGRYLRSGLRAGDAAVIIASPAHADGIAARLDESGQSALNEGRLRVVDAEALLGKFMVGGHPDEGLFLNALERIMGGLFLGDRGPCDLGPRNVRAFGEMVDLLWQRGNSAAALELDALWNRARRRFDLSLFCAYTMSNFYKQDESGQFRTLCELHTHVIPTEDVAWHSGNAFDCLRQVSLLEQRARLLENEVQYRKEVESALTESMLVRGRLEAELRAVAARELDHRPGCILHDGCRELLGRVLEPLHHLVATAREMSSRRETPVHEPGWQQLATHGTELQALIERLVAPTEVDSAAKR